MKNYIKSVVALTVICAVISVLLALANHITAPLIEKNQSASANQSLLVVMPDGEDFETVDISKYTLPATIKEVFTEKNGGYVFKIETSGYAPNLIIMCGVDKNGTVTGATCIASGETLGYETTYGENTKGATAETVDSLEIISGATKTTEGYKGAIKDALNSFIIIGGGSVDLRDEAQVLNDNLSEALPSANGKFTKIFIAEELSKVTSAFSADNGSGFVFVSDETFIPTDLQGNILTEIDQGVKTDVESDISKIVNSKLTEIDISIYANMPSQVVKAYKTATGNYVFDLKAAGFGINGDEWYKPSGEYIYIKASATASGKIIHCETISQKETDSIGSACANESFYSQFNSKDETNYKDIDAISGATITTNGYKTAIGKIFEAIKILEGGTF